MLLALTIYALWAAATWWHALLPLPLLAVIGGWTIAWHGSLQHEVIHGHPTRSRGLNRLVAGPPLCLWLPFEIYRRTHVAHHATPHLTDPTHDPEARYLPVQASRLSRALARLQSTLAGRLILGPFIEISRFLVDEGGLLLRGEPGRAVLWLRHLAGAGLVLAWLAVCHLKLEVYLLAFVYPGAALSLLRSYVEHRADADPHHRVAIVERAPVLGLLFLNNNLHAVHHERPDAAWHQLPGLYARDRARVLRANGGLVYAGYGEVARRFLLRPRDPVLHPGDGRPA